MKKSLISMMIALFFSISCSSEKKSDTQNPIINLVIGESYVVYTGDKIEKTSPNSQISINKNTQTDITTVILTQGSAILIRNE